MNTNQEMWKYEKNTYEAKMVCKIKIYVYKSSIRVRRVKRAPELIDKVLHKWDDQVSYDTLTLETIIQSDRKANETNEEEAAVALLEELLES